MPQSHSHLCALLSAARVLTYPLPRLILGVEQMWPQGTLMGEVPCGRLEALGGTAVLAWMCLEGKACP